MPLTSPVRACVRPGDAAQGGFVPRHAEEQVHQHLKRRHAACILSLRDEFMRKRKKGKLPSEATTTMKTWWESNVVWPYPTVRALMQGSTWCGGVWGLV